MLGPGQPISQGSPGVVSLARGSPVPARRRFSPVRVSPLERSPHLGRGGCQAPQGRPPQGAQQPASSCRARSAMREKVLAQRLHLYFLVSECVCRWARRLERSAKALLQ